MSNIDGGTTTESVKTSYDGTDLIIENTAQRLPGEVVQAIATRRSAHLAMLEAAHETDLTPEMRREDSELRRRVASLTVAPGLDGLDTDLRAAALKRSDQIAAILKDRIERREKAWLTYTGKWRDVVTAPPVDHSFWWAKTQSHVAPDMKAEFRSDGLHFRAGPKVTKYDGEIHASFGAVAYFALQPERFPTSPSGIFLSSPHVELFGGVVAYAPNWDLIQGNGIASCTLFLRQTILQYGFGQTGPVPLLVAEAKGNDQWRLYLKNTGYSRHGAMPGFKLIPAVAYGQNQIIPTQTLYAEIEVRFDIYLNCSGALLWCDPEVLLRNFQWAPTPLP